MLGKLGLATGLLLVAGGVTVAFGAVPSSDGTINSCYTKRAGLLTPAGNLRVIDEGESCRSTEIALSFNQRGPQGIPGPQGETGAQGPAGEPGASAGDQVFFAHRAGNARPESEGDFRLVKALPAGSYVIEAQVNAQSGVSGDAANFIQCRLPGDVSVSVQLIEVFIGRAGATFPLSSAIDHPGGEITLRCLVDGGSPDGTTFVDATMLATTVASVG